MLEAELKTLYNLQLLHAELAKLEHLKKLAAQFPAPKEQLVTGRFHQHVNMGGNLHMHILYR